MRALLLLTILLSACGAAPPPTPAPPTPNVQATVAPAVVATQTATLTPAPTTNAAPSTRPPSPTPAPTSAPTPTAAPPTKPAATAGQWTPDQVITAFKFAGLEAVNASKMSRQDFGMAPLVGEGIHFFIPSLCPDCGGRVFAVPVAADRERLAAYYREPGKASAALSSHVFIRDNIVVQLNGELNVEQAAKYEAALKAME